MEEHGPGEGMRGHERIPLDGVSLDEVPAELRAVLSELEDATDVRAARVSRETGDEVISWEQAKAEADL